MIWGSIMGKMAGIRTLGFGICLGGFFAVSGGQELLLAFRNSTPLEVSCADLQKSAPHQEWVAMKGCSLDVSAATYLYDEDSGKISELYIPLFAGEQNESKTKVSLHTTKLEWLELFSKLQEVKNSEKEIEAFYQKNEKLLRQTGDFEGVVEKGITGEPAYYQMLKETDDDLAEGFFIVRHEKKPSFAMGASFFGLGALSGLYGLLFGIRKFRR
jgi:hypothetical protein